MKFKVIYLIGILILSNSCINNSLDEGPKVDCSVSILDFTFITTNGSCGQSNGSLVVMATGGQPPYKFTIDNGASTASGDFNNLTPGNYSISVSDEATCSVTKEITIGNTGGFQAIGSVTVSGCGTANGTFTITPVGGEVPYSYKLDGGPTQTSDTFSGLGAGEYEALITDAIGCDFSIIQTIATGISFASTIKPIIANSCATTGCHDGSTAQTNFTIFSNVQNSSSGIRSRTQSGVMPKNGSLTQQEIDVIACWVDDGAKEN